MGADPNNLVDELRGPALELDAAVWGAGLQGRFTSTRRSRSEQTRLYRAYISGRHPFPVVPPGTSAHEYGEAFDYVVTPAEYQTNVGETWRAWGGVWAGASDVVHFELPGASARAAQQGRELSYDPIGGVLRTANALPWYVGLLLPWQISLFEQIPSLQTLIDPAWPLFKIKAFLNRFR